MSRVGAQNLELTPIDCNLVLTQVLEDLQVAIQDRQATIDYDFLPTVFADETQLTELLQNLICNAIKFSPPERSPQIRISVSKKNKNGCLKYAITASVSNQRTAIAFFKCFNAYIQIKLSARVNLILRHFYKFQMDNKTVAK